MRYRLFGIVAAIILIPVLAALAAPGNNALAQTDNGTIRIEVSRHGCNQTPGEFRLEVEAGREVVISFVYGDDDLPGNNPPQIFITGYNIPSDVLDQENPEIIMRFTPDSSGEVSFMCILYCTGHENLQKGRITIHQVTKPLEGGDETSGALLLIAPEQALSGQPLTLTAALRDSQDRPIVNAPVKFLIKVDFFTTGLIEIGEAVTDEEGVGILEYIPRQTGDIEVVASYNDIETTTTISLTEKVGIFYHTESGLPHVVSWPEVFLDPNSALEAVEGGVAPTIELRIPGGLPSLLLLAYVFAVILVWSLYLRVMYQVFRIPPARQTGDINVRLIPSAGMAVMLFLVTLLVLILITGPYSHPHILR